MIKSNIHSCKKIFSYLLYLYSFLLFLMHFIRIFDNSFWGDEGYTIQLVQMNFVKMCISIAADVHPPLYYFFTQILYHILGNHGYTYHLSAVLPYGMILVLACTVIRKWFGLIPAAIVVTFSSLTSNAIIYNVEVRMYSLGALFVLAAFLNFYQIYKKNQPIDWVLFGFASLCAAYTHYYALISVAFFYLMLLPLWRKGKDFQRRIVRLYGITILSYLVWLYALLKSFKRTVDGWWLESIATFSDCFDFIWGARWLSIVTMVLFIYYFVCFIWSQMKDRVISDENVLFMAGLFSILGTILVGLVLSYTIRPFLVPRYLFPLTPVAYLMFGLCIQKLKWKRPLAAIFIIAVLLTGGNNWWKTYQHETLLDAGTQQGLNCIHPSSDAVIYTNDSAIGWSLMGYYFPDQPYASVQTLDASLDPAATEAWCIWTAPLTEEDLSFLQQNHFSFEEVYQGQFMKDSFKGAFFTEPYDQIFHIYKIQRTPEATK